VSVAECVFLVSACGVTCCCVRLLPQRGNELVRQKIHPTSIISGYRLARKEAVKYIKVGSSRNPNRPNCLFSPCCCLVVSSAIPCFCVFQDFLLIPTEKLEREFLVSAAKVSASAAMHARVVVVCVCVCVRPRVMLLLCLPADMHVIQDYWRVV
jgi:hypothetical protein